jgi:hypothetical protein
MNIILRFLVRYEILIYLLLGLVVIIFLRRIFSAWKEWRTALFGMEKEHSQFTFNQGLTIVIFCAFLALTLFIMTTFVAPAVPNLQQVSTPTIDLTAQATKEQGIAAQVTQTTSGLIPTLNSVFDKGCIAGQIEWTNPVDGETISGTVSLEGTVNVDDLGYYKYEYALAGSESWVTIAAGSTKVVEGSLGGAWDTTADDIIPGDYQLRLVVYDHQNNVFPECMIQVTIVSGN